jgi:hypothetical protein
MLSGKVISAHFRPQVATFSEDNFYFGRQLTYFGRIELQ